MNAKISVFVFCVEAIIYLLLYKLLQACNFIKKDTLAQVFPYEFWEISKGNFLTEHPWATDST